jgi:ADP-ribose pyrophosphatase YjhB (NUDIX family)
MELMNNIAVSVAVIHEGKVLLTKREDFQIWCLPGGIVGENESLAEAALREIKEETGAEVELNSLVGIYSRLGGMRDEHAVVFRGTQTGGELRIQKGETIEVAYFPFDQLPDEILLGHKRRILDAIQGRKGIAVRQEEKNSIAKRISRRALYQLRDQSSLSRREFYLQIVKDVEVEDRVEVDGE